MRLILTTSIGLLVLAGEFASADVLHAEAAGFKIVNKALVGAGPEEAWRAAVKHVDKWWSSDHTVSGDASRLHIDPQPQGCFCEALGRNAGVVHLTVTMVYPPTVLRLTGGLGPLGLMGVDGNMTWEFEAVDDGTEITFTYAVGGFRPGGLGDMAAPVDSVIADALKRLQSYIDTGDAEYSAVE